MNQTKVTSVDFVPEIVAKMTARGTSGVTYAEADFTAYTYGDNSFDYLVDKGSFDAICLDNEADSQEKYNKYLTEQVRVLDAANGGKFLIISLLQELVIDALLNYFLKGENNPHHADYVFDVAVVKLDKIATDNNFNKEMTNFSYEW
jgi:ubiquinone/menaquinone biosynthesis C-methylase UbiE